MDHQETIWIKEEETDDVPDEQELVFLEDPLKTEVPGFSIKPDPELKSCTDSSETNVVALTRCASNRTRLIQNSGEMCGISLEESLTLVVPNELKITAEESTHSMKFDTQKQRLQQEEKEDDLLVTRLNCSKRENEINKFRCNFCLQSFASKYTLTMHVFIHMDGLQPPSNVCKSCGEVFPSDISLNKHLKFSDCDKTSSATQIDQFDRIYKHEKIFLECGREFSNIEYTKQQSPQPNIQAFSATGMRAFKCDVCGKLFTLMCNLKKHLLIHTGQRPHKCDVCGKTFTESGNLNSHLLIHTGLRPHKCNVCGKSFTRLGNLNTHALLHTGQRPHKCNVCGKSFTQSGNLKNHAVIHTGQRRHKCNVCGKSFTAMSSLKKHSLIHTCQESHKCIVCGKTFAHVRSLENHASIHTGQSPHKCNVCGKSFTELGSLKKHALIHTGQRPHKCIVCGKSFTESGNLKKHSLIHTGRSPHRCNVCGRSFPQMSNLKAHLLIHT